MSKNNVKWLVIHHTGGTDLNPMADTSNHTFEIVDQYHKNLGWGKIGYHYFISKEGDVKQGRMDFEEGAHCNQVLSGVSLNVQSLGIALAGNFDLTMPTVGQIKALKDLIKSKMLEYNIPLANVVPHRKFASKSCYGQHLSDEWIKTILNEAPVSPPCVQEKAVVEEQRRQIRNLQDLIDSIIKLFKK